MFHKDRLEIQSLAPNNKNLIVLSLFSFFCNHILLTANDVVHYLHVKLPLKASQLNLENVSKESGQC